MALMSDRFQSNGNDHLSNLNTLECLHLHTAYDKDDKDMTYCELSNVP